jgi:hypothetical protein
MPPGKLPHLDILDNGKYRKTWIRWWLIVILLIVAAVYAVLYFYCGWCGK